MDEEYILKPSKFFLEQVEELSDKAARIVESNVATMRSLKRVASGMRQTTARAGKGKFILKIINLV